MYSQLPVRCLWYVIPLGWHPLLSPRLSAWTPPLKTPPPSLQGDIQDSTATGRRFHKLRGEFMRQPANHKSTGNNYGPIMNTRTNNYLSRSWSWSRICRRLPVAWLPFSLSLYLHRPTGVSAWYMEPTMISCWGINTDRMINTRLGQRSTLNQRFWWHVQINSGCVDLFPVFWRNIVLVFVRFLLCIVTWEKNL